MDVLTKICSRCGRELPATNEYFYRNKYGKLGLRGDCKECRRNGFKRINRPGFKICSKCLKEKPSTAEFFRRYKTGRRSLRSECKMCEKIYRDASRGMYKAWAESPAMYDTYADQLIADEVRRDPIEPEFLQVRCKLCGEWMWPTNRACHHRRIAINSDNGKECNFYCSIGCKNSCSLYGLNPNHVLNQNIESNDRPYQAEWAKMVIDRAGNECEMCGSTDDLQAHHERPVKTHPHLQADLDNGICLCATCHKKYGHSDECSTGKLANMVCN
jgi:hypothetical protein